MATTKGASKLCIKKASCTRIDFKSLLAAGLDAAELSPPPEALGVLEDCEHPANASENSKIIPNPKKRFILNFTLHKIVIFRLKKAFALGKAHLADPSFLIS
jgi:hypothetical protein